MLASFYQPEFHVYIESTHPMSMYPIPPHQYHYAAPPPPQQPPRQYSSHATSSAFSSSANPDEDWTKISDLAERRRIQNRIAQRNYRKKLKRRLEDLERRAGEEGTSGPEKSQGETKSAGLNANSTAGSSSGSGSKRQSSSSPSSSKPSHRSSMAKTPTDQGQFTPPMQQDDEFLVPPAYDDGRQRSHTPPLFPYAPYPPPQDELMMVHGYPPAHAYPGPMAAPETYPSYLAAPAPVTLPPMNHFNDALKREAYPSDDSLAYMSYGYIPGVEMTASHPYEHSEPHTPPLSHSYDHSANCSETAYEYPTTPLSMPGSPGMAHQS